MAELKTKPTTVSAAAFIKGIEDAGRRKDCAELESMMTKATKAKPVMFGPAIIGFGDWEYTGSNGKTNKWFQVGFSQRKAALSLYLMGGKDKALLAKLGKVKVSGTEMAAGCIYIKQLDDIHRPTLQKLIETSVKNLRQAAKK